MPIYPNGKGRALTGRYAYILTHGGRFSDCGCKGAIAYDSNGSFAVSDKFGTCWHTATRLAFMFVKAGWEFEEALALALDPSSQGFAVMQNKPDPEREFATYWEHSRKNLSEATNGAKGTQTPKRPQRRSKGRSEASTGVFSIQPTRLDDLLDVVEGNPGIHTRALERVLMSSGWRKGHVSLYLEHALKRGYVRFELGSNRMHHHYLIRRASLQPQDILGTDDTQTPQTEPHVENHTNPRGSFIGTPFIVTPGESTVTPEDTFIGTPDEYTVTPEDTFIVTPDDDDSARVATPFDRDSLRALWGMPPQVTTTTDPGDYVRMRRHEIRRVLGDDAADSPTLSAWRPRKETIRVEFSNGAVVESDDLLWRDTLLTAQEEGWSYFATMERLPALT